MQTRFDWLSFFQRNAIEYVERGPNVARGNVNIRCPFCNDDPSHHLGVALDGAGWGCWRRRDHRGRSPIRLVMALLRCDFETARSVVGSDASLPADFMSQVSGLITSNTVTPAQKSPDLCMPAEFKAFHHELPSARPFVAYMVRRGFTPRCVMNSTRRFGLRYATQGDFAGRIVFPVMQDGKLITWTGRSIYADAHLRYKALGMQRPDKPRDVWARDAIINRLLWYDDLLRDKADTLFLVEGPFDALKVRVLGRRHGVTATCFFTAAPSPAQIDLLNNLIPRYRHCVLLLDRGTLATSLQVLTFLRPLGVRVANVPDHLKDPGEFSRSDFRKFVIDLRRRALHD